MGYWPEYPSENYNADYAAKKKAMWDAATIVTGELLERYKRKCQENIWIKVGGAEFEPEGFCCESDYEYGLTRFDDIEMLKAFFEHGNWAIRQGVQYQDLIFVQQVNGGDEWWTLKVTDDKLVAFESITMKLVIERGTFEEEIGCMVRATAEQCRRLEYHQA